MVELLLVVSIILLLASLAIPNLLASRRAANEASAISALRTLHGAQLTYKTTYGSGLYAGTLSSLEGQRLVDSTIGSGVKAGYTFEVTANPPSGTSAATFSISAVPTTSSGLAQTGARNFCVRTEGVIRAETGAAMLGIHIPYDECVDGQPGIVPL